MTSRSLLRIAPLLLALLLGACSSFDARWKSAATRPDATRWEGRWTSEKHRTPSGPASGRLRAVLEPAPAGRVTAHFHANWQIFSSDYTMTLNPKTPGAPRAGAKEFVGTHELPKIFGGVYHYEARIAGDDFRARYHSSYDHGLFSLQRVRGAKEYASGHAGH